MSNSQCLPEYTSSFLKEDCQPVGNGGQIFTDYRPSQEILAAASQSLKNNHHLRQHQIKSAQSEIKKDTCAVINKTRCHYMNVPDKCGE